MPRARRAGAGSRGPRLPRKKPTGRFCSRCCRPADPGRSSSTKRSAPQSRYSLPITRRRSSSAPEKVGSKEALYASEIGRGNRLVGVVTDAGVVDEHIDSAKLIGYSRRPSRPERRPQRQRLLGPFPAPLFRPSPDRARPTGHASGFERAGDRPRDRCRGCRPSRRDRRSPHRSPRQRPIGVAAASSKAVASPIDRQSASSDKKAACFASQSPIASAPSRRRSGGSSLSTAAIMA